MDDPSVHPTKMCPKCGKLKPATAQDFPRNRRTKDGFGSWCKACFNGIAATKRPPPRRKPTIPERFWEKVDKRGAVAAHRPELGECWMWLGGTNRGYGAFYLPRPVRNNVGAHVYSWELHRGETVPSGHQVNHHCDNPLCVRPEHLFVGTQLDNMRDKVSKRRQARGEAGGNARLVPEAVLEIRRLHRDGGLCQADIGALFGVKQATVWSIIRRHTWRHLPETTPPSDPVPPRK